MSINATERHKIKDILESFTPKLQCRIPTPFTTPDGEKEQLSCRTYCKQLAHTFQYGNVEPRNDGPKARIGHTAHLGALAGTYVIVL